MLTTDLIAQVRQGADEDNTSDWSDAKVLAALNRAQQKLTRLSARHYPEMLKRELVSSTFDGRTLLIPNLSNAFNVNQVDAFFGGVTFRVDYTNTTNVTGYETNDVTSIPAQYSVMGNKILLYPRPQPGVQIRVRYQLRAPKLVVPKGRITSFDTENGYLYLDELPTGDDALTTSTSRLGAFINTINKFTGDILGTYQILDINMAAKRLTIKPDNLYRSEVYGLPVTGTLSDLIIEDDYITQADGSCIPIYYSDYSDYLTQHAVVEIKRTLNLNIDNDQKHLDNLENDVKLIWASRPTGIKVQARNKHWGRPNLTNS